MSMRLLQASSVLMEIVACTTAGTTSAPSDLAHDPRMVRWRQAMFWGVILFLVFVFATAALVVFSRRYGAYMGQRKSRPTDSRDVWAMHHGAGAGGISANERKGDIGEESTGDADNGGDGGGGDGGGDGGGGGNGGGGD